MKLISILFLTLLLAGCTAVSPEPSQAASVCPTQAIQTVPPTEATEATEPTPPPSPEEMLLGRMSLREKVGQLFIVRPDALDLSLPAAEIDDPHAPGALQMKDSYYETLNLYPVGGFVQFSKNIQAPDQLVAFNQQLSDALTVPPFLAVDEEGGLVARVANTPGFDLPKYRSAGSVGAAYGTDGALEMGSAIGGYLNQYGFNMDFAPVADVNTNPANPVIGTRSFSPDPRQAALCARAAADGLSQNGIIPVFKHFPGHGDTAEDSHLKLAASYKTMEQLEQCEWLPFLQAADSECIMVGHIALPEVTGDMTPATLSRPIVTGLLREHLGFRGLVITDSLTMGAIVQAYTPAQAALAALNAGCDLLLMPQSLTEAFDGVVAAVEDGSFPEEVLDSIVLRILNFKIQHQILVP